MTVIFLKVRPFLFIGDQENIELGEGPSAWTLRCRFPAIPEVSAGDHRVRNTERGSEILFSLLLLVLRALAPCEFVIPPFLQ